MAAYDNAESTRKILLMKYARPDAAMMRVTGRRKSQTLWKGALRVMMTKGGSHIKAAQIGEKA